MAKQIVEKDGNHYLVEIKFVNKQKERRIASKSNSPIRGSPVKSMKNFNSQGSLAYRLHITANNLSGDLSGHI